MRHLWLCLLGLACAQAAEEPVLIADPVPVIAEVCADLDEAARLASVGEAHAADQAWLRAHASFDEALEPWIRHHQGDRAALELDYRLGRLRTELDRRRGDPLKAAGALAERLRALPVPAPAPSGA